MSESKAVSARYPNLCLKCGARAFHPCRSLESGRVTDTHQVRIDRQFVDADHGTRVGEWGSD